MTYLNQIYINKVNYNTFFYCALHYYIISLKILRFFYYSIVIDCILFNENSIINTLLLNFY